METLQDIDRRLEDMREGIFERMEDINIEVFLQLNEDLDDFARKFRCNTVKPQQIFARLFTFNDYKTLLTKLPGIEKVNGSIDMDTKEEHLATFLFSISYKQPFLIQEALYDLITIIRNCGSISIRVSIEQVEDQVYQLKIK